MRTDLQNRNFSVYTEDAHGSVNKICNEVSAREAANELWRCTHNFSARAGLVVRVMIVDVFDRTVMEWISGRGYTYDGENYMRSPVMNEEEVH